MQCLLADILFTLYINELFFYEPETCSILANEPVFHSSGGQWEWGNDDYLCLDEVLSGPGGGYVPSVLSWSRCHVFRASVSVSCPLVLWF